MKKDLKRLIYLFGALIIGGLTLTSCIKDKLPNIEVDITNIYSNDAGYIKSIVNENSVSVFVDALKTDKSNLGIIIEVSDGATITPDPTTVTDYTEPQYFTVVSEDKVWTKIWEVNVTGVSENFPIKYNFDNWYNPENTKYKIPYEIIDDGGKQTNLFAWATTNGSMSIVLSYIYGQYLTYKHFGVAPADDIFVTGNALKLETLDIAMIAPTMPYVSGTTFIGEFDPTATDPNKGTHFGYPFNRKPLTFKGKYMYDPQTIKSTSQTDKGMMKAVLFKVTDEKPYLDGYDILNMHTDNIIGYAEFYPDKKTNGFEDFSVPFTYNSEVDPEDLENWQYAITVYFTSSKEGYQFVGAGGTKMYIDDAELVCE